MSINVASFQKKILNWYRKHGRHHLPWQKNVNTYRVWISEIMLQQTQVATVIPYFERFMQAFPNVQALANAPIDAVLSLWSGLGYYARARNLHKTACIIVEQHQGKFPEDVAILQTLPGIGCSTAGAIAAFAYGQSAPILDANVKRVLARFHAMKQPLNDAVVLKQLWELSAQYTPRQHVAAYTQAMMDLGATLCVRKNPKCKECPLHADCLAYQRSLVDTIPYKKRKTERAKKAIYWAVLQNSLGQFLLERRPGQGVWGGLWCFPEFESQERLEQWVNGEYQGAVYIQQLPKIKHLLTHIEFDIVPMQYDVRDESLDFSVNWFDHGEAVKLGLPQPVRRLLQKIQ